MVRASERIRGRTESKTKSNKDRGVSKSKNVLSKPKRSTKVSTKALIKTKKTKPIRKRLFYDIETSFIQGHFWWPGSKVRIGPDQILKYPKIICISYKWEHEDVVHNVAWDINDQDDKPLLVKFVDILNEADEIVAHNGDSFDLKWIRARALKHDIPMRATYSSIDTYKILKNGFRIPSNRLGEAAKYLGLDNKMDPGGLETWRRIIMDKDQKALDIMIEYCNQDVRTLEQLYEKLKNYVLPKTNYATLNKKTKSHCPECTGDNLIVRKKFSTPTGMINRYMRCKDCGRGFKFSDRIYQLYKLAKN